MTRRYVLGNTQSEYLYINYMSFDSIFYLHSVVGGDVNYIEDIYGGRTSLLLTS